MNMRRASALSMCIKHLPHRHASAYARTDGRTDGLTKMVLGASGQLTVGDAHAPVLKFESVVAR